MKDITVLSQEIELSNSGIGYSRSGELLSDVMIQGYSGSTAEAYANENGFDFIVLDEETVTTTAPTSTETTTTSTSAEITSQNTSESTSVTSSVATTAVSTTSEKASTKENSPKTGDKGIIGIGITMLSTLGLLCISKRKF